MNNDYPQQIIEECLFIGGPKDGHRIKVEVGRPYQTYDGDKNIGHIDNSFTYKVVGYLPIKFGGVRDTATIYVVDGLTADDVLKALVSRYPLPLQV